ASGRTSAMRSPSITSVPGDRIRSGRTSAAPDSTIIGAPRSYASPVGVDLKLAPDERRRERRIQVVASEQHPVDARQQQRQLAFVRGIHHDDAAALVGREAPVVEIV